MSFEQHPDQDGQGREPQDAETTGRIYGSDDHTAHLPAHPRPDTPRPDAAFGSPQGQQPQQGSYGSAGPQYGAPQQPQIGAQQPQQPQQPSYAASGAPAGPYAPPVQAQGGGHPGGPGYGAPSYTNNQPPFGDGPYNGNGNGPKKSKRWAAVPVAAVLAAALASGGTYALTRDSGGSSSAGGSHTTVVQADGADFGGNGVNWAAAATKVAPSVVSITVIAGGSGDQGSGVVLDKSGNIVTNNHVVTGAGDNPKVTVTLNDNRTYDATVVGTDVSTDLAVIKLDEPPKNLKPITLGDDKKLVVGQPVMAVGNPLGLAGTVTTGIVSALNRPVTVQQESQDQDDNPFAPQQAQCTEKNCSTTNAIQTSAAINPGNSGGALVTGSGKLIGINSSIATLGQSSGSSQSGNIGIGFAIPVTVVKNITTQLMKTGSVKHPRIGVQVASQPGTVKVGDATEQAARIVSVVDGSPADKAGIKAGDLVTKFNGEQVSSADALIGFVRAHNVGDKVTLTISRDGKQQDVTVTLGEASSS